MQFLVLLRPKFRSKHLAPPNPVIKVPDQKLFYSTHPIIYGSSFHFIFAFIGLVGNIICVHIYFRFYKP